MSEKFDEELYGGATPLETPVEDVSVFKSSRYRPATELDFDPEGRKGLLPVTAERVVDAAERVVDAAETVVDEFGEIDIPSGETVAENVQSLPERIQTSLEARTEESKRAGEERLKEAGDVGPTAIKTEYEIAKDAKKVQRPSPTNIPVFNKKEIQNQRDLEAEKRGELTLSGVVRELSLTPRGIVAGVAPPTQKDLAKMTSEERRKYEESLKIDIDSGAMSLLPAIATLGSLASEYVGQPVSDFAKSVLSYTPLATLPQIAVNNVNFLKGNLSEMEFPFARAVGKEAVSTFFRIADDQYLRPPSALVNYSQQNKEALNAVAGSVGEIFRRDLEIDIKKDLPAFGKAYLNFQRALAVPYEDKNVYYSSLGIAGSFAPFGGIVGVGRAASLGLANTGKGVLVAYALGGAVKRFGGEGVSTAIRGIPFGRVFDFNPLSSKALARKPIPEDLLKFIRGTSSYKQKAEQFYRTFSTKSIFPPKDPSKFQTVLLPPTKLTSGGMSMEKAIQSSDNMYRDLISAVGGGVGYGLVETYDPEASDSIKLGFSILGAFSANGVFKAAEAGFDNTIGGILGVYNMVNKESRDRLLNSMSEGGEFSTFRQSTFIAMGYTRKEINRLRSLSFERGNEELRRIRELKEAGNTAEANKVLEAAQQEGILNSKGKINEYYHIGQIMDSKFDRKTMAFASDFWNRIENIKDPKIREDFKQSMADVYSYMDGLYTKYPKAMKPFVLLLENATQLSVLNSLRQSLLNKAEFTSKSGGFVTGDLISDIDKYTESLQKNVSSLKNVVNEMKGTGDDIPEILEKLTDDLEKSLVLPLFEKTTNKIADLKKFASEKQSKVAEENLQLSKELNNMAGVKNLEDPEAIRASGRIQQKLFDDLYTQRTNSVNEVFDALREQFKGETIDISAALQNVTETAGQLDTPVRKLLKEFGSVRLTDSQRLSLQDSLAEEFFKDKIGPLVRKADGTLDDDKILDLIGNMLESLPYKATADEKTNLLATIQRDLDNSVDETQKLTAVFGNLIDKIPFPAEINIPSFMALRSSLLKDANNFYRAGKYTEYRNVSERIEFLDDVLEQSPSGALFKKQYQEAREFYRKTLGVFNDPMSPTSKFRFAKKDGDLEDESVAEEITSTDIPQLVSPHQLFDSFIKSPNKDANAAIFKNAFLDKETGEYSQEAMQQLMFALTRHAHASSGGANPTGLRTIISDFLPYFDEIFKGSKNEKFTDSLRRMLEYKLPESTLSEENIKSAYKVIKGSLDEFTKVFEEHFSKSVIQQFTDTELSLIKSSMKNAGQSRNPEESLKILFGNSGQSVDFPALQTFLNNIKVDSNFIALNPAARERFMDIVNSPEFIRGLREVSEREGISTSAKPAMQQILEDVAKNAPDKYEETKNNLKAILFHQFGEAMFPATTSVAKTPLKRNAAENDLFAYLAKENDTTIADVSFRLTAARDADMIAQARQYIAANDAILPEVKSRMTRSMLGGRLGRGFKFNLDNELDPIAMQKYYNENRRIFELLLDKDHLEAVDELMNLGVLTGSTPLTQSLKNLPSDYTTAMALGRTYNAMKGVVSWRYLAMEKVISDYRVAQADVMRSVLSDPNSAKVMAGVLSRGVFKKREGREMLRDIVTKIAPYGYRLSSSNSINEMEEDLERLAASVRKDL
tara:strand:- start:76 stop:5037 length:4962 start_codon:yes stop_codon:yes gene_type:complete